MTTNYQDSDGALLPAVRKRIRTVREKLGYSWLALGEGLGFSNTFVQGISREKNPQNIRPMRVAGLIQNLEGLEVKAGILKVADMSQPSASTSISASATAISSLSLEELVNAIAAKGFTVTISPVAKA
jgi:hypothetical protein